MREPEEALRRTFTGVGDRKVLSTGFIGRRSEMHEVRRRIRRGNRVFIFQGLGGLGKSTLAFHVLPMLQRGEGDILSLWCQEVEQQPDRLEGLVGQLLEHCRKRFGLDWEQVVYQVDRTAGDDPIQRFAMYLQVLRQKVPRLVLYLDNLESLQIGPKDSAAEGDAEVIGEWASEDLGRLWTMLTALARQADNFYVVASCRYMNPGFAGALLPVSPLPLDALLRLMNWFPSLRRLSFVSQVHLVERLAGHPRAVEYADDLVAYALAVWEERHGRWQEGNWREWSDLVEPALPKVRDKLRANLLLAEIWDRVLTDRERRMFYRMTLLRQPWEWTLMAVLGDEEEGDEEAFATADRLRRTSLLEQVELFKLIEGDKFAPVWYSTLHPATVQLVRERFGENEALLKATHRRLGDFLEDEAQASNFIEVFVEAGYHLFQSGEYDRALKLLGPASQWLRKHGRAREGLRVLEPFLPEQVCNAMTPECVEELLSTLGSAYADLGELEKAIECHEQALVIARKIGDRRVEGGELGYLGQAYASLGELERAIGYYKQGLVVARELGDRQSEGSYLGGLGIAHARLGDKDEAIKYLEQDLMVAREAGYRQGEGNALGNMGLTYAMFGNLERAIEYFWQNLEIVRETGDRRGEGSALGNLGIAHAQLGELEEAIWYYEQALVLAREIEDPRGEGNALGNAGLVYAEFGETGKAITLLEQALVIGQAINDPQIIENTSGALGQLRAHSSP